MIDGHDGATYHSAVGQESREYFMMENTETKLYRNNNSWDDCTFESLRAYLKLEIQTYDTNIGGTHFHYLVIIFLLAVSSKFRSVTDSTDTVTDLGVYYRGFYLLR